MGTISVVMPVYNADRFVAAATESILAQTFGDFELIAIDDGSTDRSREILERLAQRDPRLRVFSRANHGQVATLNEGIALARFPLIARMDADDLCDPRRFELQVQALSRDSTLVAIGSCAVAIDEEGRGLGDYSRAHTLTHDGIEECHLRGEQAIHSPSVTLRADVVRALGGYRDFVVCEDFDLYLRLGEVGRLANLPERLLIKRLHPASLMATKLEERHGVLERIMADAWRRRKLPGVPPAPSPSDPGEAALYRTWGWMAMRDRHLRTARYYALKAIATEPLTWANWQLMADTLRTR